jgi:hypothetical protein
MSSRKKNDSSAKSHKKGKKDKNKKDEKVYSGPITVDELLDKLNPIIEYQNDESYISDNHPILGSKLKWVPTPIESSNPIKQLYYVLTKTDAENQGCDHDELIHELETQHTVRSLTMRELLNLSQKIDTNIIIIGQNNFIVVSPDPKIFNRSRHTIVTYNDDKCYYSVQREEYILKTLLKTHPANFKEITDVDNYPIPK